MEWLLGRLNFLQAWCRLTYSALQSLNLPGSIQALERPAGLPPSLLKKAEEVESEGGVQRIQSLLTEVQRLSKSNSKLLSDVCPILSLLDSL
jgi:programmed cell death 6-interacting protein